MNKRNRMIDFNKITTYPISQRKSKVTVDDFVKISDNIPEIARTIEVLFPDILMGKDIRKVIEAIVTARNNGGEVALMMGAHAIKCGLSPLLIKLVDEGIVTHIATNGAGAIHDFEIAFSGKTSEDVAAGLEDGTFGMAEETGYHLNEAYIRGASENLGMGESVSRMIDEMNLPFREYSLFYRAAKAGVPVTVHTSIGTDIIHQHPHCSGEAIGKVSYTDFRRLADTLSRLEGGVIFNLGSAVILPEVFLKALTVVRNLGNPVLNFTAVNLDKFDHYRPRVNVLDRPTRTGGKSWFLQGPMEILLPIIVYGAVNGKREMRADR